MLMRNDDGSRRYTAGSKIPQVWRGLFSCLKNGLNIFSCHGVNIPADCLYCGVCCHAKSGTYVRVSETDLERLGEEAEHWVRQVGGQHYMRMEEGHCAALQITKKRGEPGVFFCQIYARRPQVCRDLARGKAACQTELRSKADRVSVWW